MKTMVVSGAVVSDAGCAREVNEDSARLVNPAGSDLEGDRSWLAVVADGMGGHAAGEVASRIATETIAGSYSRWPEDPARGLLEAVAAANRRVLETAAEDPELAGMGTTCTAVALKDWRAYLVHVGDSRLYLVREGGIYLMTEDDSAVMEMVRQGLITREQARTHSDRNVILRALGTHRELEVSHWQEPLPVRAGDRLVLSTDGLHDLVEDDEIGSVVQAHPPANACAALVELARSRGGPDNITVVVLGISCPEPETSSPPGETREVEVATP